MESAAMSEEKSFTKQEAEKNQLEDILMRLEEANRKHQFSTKREKPSHKFKSKKLQETQFNSSFFMLR